jgi:hypothetical protein
MTSALKLGPILSPIVYNRIIASGGDFSKEITLLPEDFDLAVKRGLTQKKCYDWMRRMYENNGKSGDSIKAFLLKKSGDNDHQNAALAENMVFFSLLPHVPICYD